MEDVICSSEIEFYVDNVTPQNLKEIGSQKWLEFHKRLQKLNQQAIIEAALVKEEFVKEIFITLNKVWVLIHEALLINVWKNKILPTILDLDKNPKCTFVAYSVLFHEAISVALLEILLFHSGCCEMLEDHAADLLDYAYDSAAQLIIIKVQDEMEIGESTSQELYRQRNNLSFDIGIRSLSIIRYMAENLHKMVLNVSSRVYNVHDVPMLLVQILLQKPWLRDGKCFNKGKWVEVTDEALSPAEAQVWLTLRYLLLDAQGVQSYAITDTRRNELQKLMPLLQPNLLDQMSPLMELNHWLCRLLMNNQTADVRQPLLLEPILELKSNILKQGEKRWKKLAKAQLAVIFPTDRETLMKIAEGLNEAYNTDLLEKIEAKSESKCAVCNNAAIQRCSRCKTAWYCSRKCQVGDWEEHKVQCSAK